MAKFGAIANQGLVVHVDVTTLERKMVFRRHQFQGVDDVPSKYYQENKSIYGSVERVIDGDTLRVRHLPNSRYYGMNSWTPPKSSKSVATNSCDGTIPIRLYGVNCPKIGKRYNQPSQPYSDQAKDFTSDLVLYRVVKVTFFRKDKYGRAVAAVETITGNSCTCRKGKPLDLSIELAKAGLAVQNIAGKEGDVDYRNGWVYSRNKQEVLEKKIAVAKHRRIGMWSAYRNQLSKNGGLSVNPTVATDPNSFADSVKVQRDSNYTTNQAIEPERVCGGLDMVMPSIMGNGCH